MFKKNKLKGSGILVVVLSAIAFSIYSGTAFLETEHFGILVENYEKNIKEKYEENIDDIEAQYNNLIIKNNMNENNSNNNR